MELTSEQVARVAHEANRAYCSILGDHTIPPWDSAPVWQKESCVMGVEEFISKRDMTPEQNHESWLKLKRSKGWKYGPKKRPEVLEHPCMVPYEQLPENQRVKDSLFLAIVKTLIPPKAVRVESPFVVPPSEHPVEEEQKAAIPAVASEPVTGREDDTPVIVKPIRGEEEAKLGALFRKGKKK